MNKRRDYDPPKITTLTSEEILDLMGPAQATASGEIVPYPGSGGGSDSAGGSGRRRVSPY